MCRSAQYPMAEYDNSVEEAERLRRQEEDLTADGSETDYEKLAEVRCEIARLDAKIAES